jgi:predicted signal transduction protein with EAL and GGDEF domain
MGLKVVAEGVETGEMLEQLKEMRCDLVQGYHLSRPLPPAKLELWLHGWESSQRKAAKRKADQLESIHWLPDSCLAAFTKIAKVE